MYRSGAALAGVAHDGAADRPVAAAAETPEQAKHPRQVRRDRVSERVIDSRRN